MTTINHHHLLWFLVFHMSLCLIVHAGFIPRPNIYDEDFLATMESNGLLSNEEENPSQNDRDRTNFYPSFFPSLYDDRAIQQMIHHYHQKNAKRSKLNLHTNLNLPRYLRTVD